MPQTAQRRIAVAETVNVLKQRAFVATELRRMAKTNDRPPDELCDVSVRSLRTLANLRDEGAGLPIDGSADPKSKGMTKLLDQILSFFRTLRPLVARTKRWHVPSFTWWPMQAEPSAAEARSHGMKTNVAQDSGRPSALPLTKHAQGRMQERRLSEETVTMVMTYGRLARVRGAEIYAVGRKELERYIVEGVDLSRFQGVQVVCSPDGTILTVYRNNDFRGLRPRCSRHHCQLAA